MKATAQALDVARAANVATERINASLHAASSRVAELSADPERASPRIQMAVEKIKAAIDSAQITAKNIQTIAFGAIALPSQATVELDAYEISILAFGIEWDGDKP